MWYLRHGEETSRRIGLVVVVPFWIFKYEGWRHRERTGHPMEEVVLALLEDRDTEERSVEVSRQSSSSRETLVNWITAFFLFPGFFSLRIGRLLLPSSTVKLISEDERSCGSGPHRLVRWFSDHPFRLRCLPSLSRFLLFPLSSSLVRHLHNME